MGLDFKNHDLLIKGQSIKQVGEPFKGDPGNKGAQGDTGNKGSVGNGIPTGGNSNAAIRKTDNSNYNTNWSDPTPTTPTLSILSQKFITSAANQATFTLSGYSNRGYQSIYVNGFKIPDSQYTISSTGVFTLNNPPELANQEVEIRQFSI